MITLKAVISFILMPTSFLFLNPTFANYIKNPISELEMFKLIDSTLNKIKLVNEELAHKKNEEELIASALAFVRQAFSAG